MKFGGTTQNDMPMMMKWSESLEVEIQYSGRSFLETRSSYISAID